jgi:hypothetical protein
MPVLWFVTSIIQCPWGFDCLTASENSGGAANVGFQTNSFIHRCLFYRVPEHGSFIAQKICISPDILWQLPCSRTRQKIHLCKSWKRAAPCVGPVSLVEVFDPNFAGYTGERVLQGLESLFSTDLQSIYSEQSLMSSGLALPPPGKCRV